MKILFKPICFPTTHFESAKYFSTKYPPAMDKKTKNQSTIHIVSLGKTNDNYIYRENRMKILWELAFR